MNNSLGSTGIVFKRRFPLGYLFHINPFTRYCAERYDSSPESWGQTLFIIGVLAGMYESHRSYLRVGPAGLEIYWHPGNAIEVAWQEVIRLERKRHWGVIQSDLLYVDRPIFTDKRKPIFLTEKIKEHFEKQRLGIPLRLYNGWPNGQLEEELNKYIPQIIAKGE
jgi:hypothetical protein